MAEPDLRCARCGATFTAYATAQRHANTQGHNRIEYVLPAKGANVPTPDRGSPPHD